MVKSWWDSSVGRVLIVEAQSLGLGFLAPCKSQAWMCTSAIPAMTRRRKAILGFHLASVVELVSSSV